MAWAPDAATPAVYDGRDDAAGRKEAEEEQIIQQAVDAVRPAFRERGFSPAQAEAAVRRAAKYLKGEGAQTAGSDDLARLRAQLVATSRGLGLLVIESDPEGARVIVGTDDWGTTAADGWLRPGKYGVVLRLKGYEPNPDRFEAEVTPLKETKKVRKLKKQ
jgi:hypothetical protein